MKADESQTPDDSGRAVRNRRAKPKKSADYVSLAATRALLGSSDAARQQRLQAVDMISIDEAEQLIGTSRVTINAWIAEGRAIGLPQIKCGFRMPVWQFDYPLWEALPCIASALRTSEGWALLMFLETPLGGLGGRTPRAAIEHGEVKQVVDLASSDT